MTSIFLFLCLKNKNVTKLADRVKHIVAQIDIKGCKSIIRVLNWKPWKSLEIKFTVYQMLLISLILNKMQRNKKQENQNYHIFCYQIY